MKYGYIRYVKDVNYEEDQLVSLKRYRCDKIVTETVHFKYEDSELKKLVDSMHEGDKLVVYSMDVLGFAVKRLMEFILMLEEKGIDLRVQKPGYDTSQKKYKVMFEIVHNLTDMEKQLHHERKKVYGHVSQEARRSLTAEGIEEIKELRRQGKTLREIKDATGHSLTTISKYAKMA